MERRYPHYLFPTKGGKWPNQVICVATAGACQEGISGRPFRSERLASWHAVGLKRRQGEYGVVKTMTGTDCNSWWTEVASLCKHPGTTWIYSHNCARVWALLAFWEYLEHDNIKLWGRDYRVAAEAAPLLQPLPAGANSEPKSISARTLRQMRERGQGYLVLEDPPCIARFRFGGWPGWLCWVDSRNYGVDPPDHNYPPAMTASWLAEFFTDMARELQYYGLGSLQATAGSQAYHGYRASYMMEPIYAHNYGPVLGLEGAAYHGGRCEAFRIGPVAVPLWHLDFRSLYPSVCVEHDLPARLDHYLLDPGRKDAQRMARAGCAIANVTVLTNEPAYPYRDETDTIFPVGTFRTALAGPELTDALEHGRIVQWHAIATYQMAACLRQYATVLYQFREQSEGAGNLAMATLAKRLLVSLPGKLGQRNRSWEPAPEVWADIPYGVWEGTGLGGEPCRYRAVAGYVHREVTDGFAPDAIPAIAAWITSAGRVKLLQAIRRAGWEHVYYVDTDSLFVDRVGLERLLRAGAIRAKELGYLQVRSGPCTVAIRGIKHYLEGDRLTCAGLPKGEVVGTADGEHYWYSQSPADAVRRGHRPDAVQVLHAYARDGKYRHGVVDEDGRVHPFTLEEHS